MTRYLKIAAVVVASAVSSTAFATEWSFDHNNVTMKSTDTESQYGVTVTSTMTRTIIGGFLKKVVSTSTGGANKPTPGTTLYGLEVPGLVYIQQPTLIGGVESQMIYSAVSGSCPTADSEGIWIFSQWDPNGANVMTSAAQPAFGTFHWDNTLRRSTITNAYNVSSYSALSGFSSFNIDYGACSGGVMTSSGPGDRGGTVYMSSEGGAFYRTNANHGLVMLPQVEIPGGHALNGNYSVYRHDSLQSQTIKHMRVVMGAGGETATGTAITDPSDNGSVDGSFADTLTITALNSPVNGMLRATISNNGGSATNVACAVYLTSRNVLFCAGQATDNAAKPLNLMLVSDLKTFNYGTRGFSGLSIESMVKNSSGQLFASGGWAFNSGLQVGGIVRLDPSTGEIDTGFLPADTNHIGFVRDASGEDVTGLAVGVTGGTDKDDLYVTGNFTTYDDGLYTRNYVARINSDYTLDTAFDPGSALDGRGRKVAVDNTGGANQGKIYVIGDFTGTLIRFLATGAVDTAFTAASGIESRAFGIETGATNKGEIYVARNWVDNGDSTQDVEIARLTATGAVDTTLGTLRVSYGAPSVWAFVPDGAGKLYVAGWFYQYKEAGAGSFVDQRMIIRIDAATGALDTGFTPPGSGISGGSTWWDGEVQSIALDGSGDIYVGGQIADFNGTSLKGLLRLNSDGSRDTGFDIGVGFAQDMYASQSPARAMLYDSSASRLYVGGHSTGYQNNPINGIAKIKTDGKIDTWGLIGGITCASYNSPQPLIVDSRDRMILTGVNVYGGRQTYGIARINPSGTLDMSWNPGGTGVEADLHSLSAGPNGTYYIGGAFDTYNGVGVPRVARLTADGALDSTWAPTYGDNSGNGFNGSIWAVAYDSSNQKTYVGGEFTSFKSLAGTTYTANRFARFNSDGSFDTSYASTIGTGFNNAVYAIQTDGAGNVYVGGSFTSFKGTTRNRIIRLTSAGAYDSGFPIGTGFRNGTSGTYVQTMKLHATGLYVGGNFLRYNSGSDNVTHLVRLTTGAVLDEMYGVDQDVYTLHVDSQDRLIAGGYFHNVDGNDLQRGGLARWTSAGVYDGAWNGIFNDGGYFWGLASDSNDNVYVSGTIFNKQGSPAQCVARLSPTDGSLN